MDSTGSIRWGIKVYTIADSKNGYVNNFDIYLGKGPANDFIEHGLCTVDHNMPFRNSNRHLYLKISFNSEVVVEGLLVSPVVHTFAPTASYHSKACMLTIIDQMGWTTATVAQRCTDRRQSAVSVTAQVVQQWQQYNNM